MTTTDLGQLHEQARRKAQEAAELAAQIDAAERVRAEARTQRTAEYDQRVVDAWDADHPALVKEQREAHREFIALLLEEPWVQAWVRARAAKWTGIYRSDEAGNAIDALGIYRGKPTVHYRDPRLAEDILEALENAARAVADDERLAREDQRERFVSGEAEAGT